MTILSLLSRFVAALAIVIATPCWAAVAVIANRTAGPASVEVMVSGAASRTLALAAGDSRPVIANSPVEVRLPGDGVTALEASCVYAINDGDGGGALSLSRFPLGETSVSPWVASGVWLDPPAGRVVDVKVLVDDDERRPRSVWEPALRARVAAASAALVAHGGAPLRVTAFEVWNSDNGESDFNRSLKEFEREVSPAPAEIAIGFSSQYEFAIGRIHLGGTRGTFHHHILVKERTARVLDAERLEMLTHELGHWMGATHSTEATSVMRPVVGQGVMRTAGATLQFDPANTLLVSLIGEEIRLRGVTKLDEVAPATRRRMAQVYAAIEPTLPDDPATAQYLAMLNAAAVGPLVSDAKHILEQVGRTAAVNAQRPLVAADAKDAGDRLLELYVRQAALAAQQVRRENGAQALILALGIAFDPRGALRELPVARDVIDRFETASERVERLKTFGQPAMHGSAELAGCFFASAHVVGLGGSDAAREVKTVRGLLEATDDGGLRFDEVEANRAGIVFANAVLMGRISLEDVAQRFTVGAYLPDADALRAELGAPAEFAANLRDAALGQELTRIEGRLMSLPVYNGSAGVP